MRSEPVPATPASDGHQNFTVSKCDNCQQQFICTSETGECTGGTVEFLALEEEEPLELLDFNDVV